MNYAIYDDVDDKEYASYQRYLTALKDYNTVTYEQEQDLLKRALDGDTDARNKLVEANLRLVVSVARHYMYFKVDFDDLIQEGNLGLFSAIGHFDLSKGYHFSTYATWWIRRHIWQYLQNNTHVIRIPANIFDRVIQYQGLCLESLLSNNRKPSLDEVMEKFNVTRSAASAIILYAENPFPISLDQECCDDQSVTYGDLMPDSQSGSVEQIILDNDIVETVQKVLLKLPERDRAIITARFGLNGSPCKTLQELGARYSIHKESVRQAEYKALAKLRKRNCTKYLEDYYI